MGSYWGGIKNGSPNREESPGNLKWGGISVYFQPYKKFVNFTAPDCCSKTKCTRLAQVSHPQTKMFPHITQAVEPLV